MGKRFTAGGLAALLVFNIFAGLLVNSIAPERASAVLIADDAAAVAIVAGSAALTYGTITAAQWAAQQGVTDKTTAALVSIGTHSGAFNIQTVMTPAVFGYLYAMRAAAVARGTWAALCESADSARAYGGYLWATLVGGLYGNVAFQSAGGGAASYSTWTGFTDADWEAWIASSYPAWQLSLLRSLDVGAAHYYGAGYVAPSADQRVVLGWILNAVLLGKMSASPIPLEFTGGSNLRVNGVGALVSYEGAAPDQTIYVWWNGTTAQASALVAQYGPGTAPAGSISAPAAEAVYTDNPDVLPIPQALTLANVGTADAGAIAIPGVANPVPWVPPVWLPKAPDISGIGDDLRGLASDVAGLFGETWSWLSAPFAGILTGMAAVTDWLGGLMSWMEQTIANIFSPSGTQLKLEFEPRWNDLKTKLTQLMPFAIVPVASLIVGSLWGGNMSGGTGLDTSWTVDFNGAHVTFHLADWLQPLIAYRWFFTACIWLWLAVTLVRMFTPIVVV